MSPNRVQLDAIGGTAQLEAEVRDQNGQTMTGVTVTWASSDPSVATVDASGLVTAAGDGSATVTAASGAAAGSAAVAVEQVAAEVRVSPDSVTLLAIGDTVRLAAEALDANGHAVAGAGFEWSSGDEAVASVDASGLVTAAGDGSATVTAASGAAAGSAAVAVEQVVAEVRVSPDSVTLFSIGDTVRLAAEALDSNGRAVAGAGFEWSSSDEAVASVGASGLVRAAGDGAATITATVGAVAGQAAVSVMDVDRAVLVTLYEATAGANWGRNANWLSDAPLREWYGVKVDDKGRVTEVNLQNNNVSGPIPPELGNLSELTSLILWANPLTGEIPPELGNLTRLRLLHLASSADNDLEGPIPPEIGNLTLLNLLSIYSDKLAGPIPSELGNLRNLRWLILGGKDLTGPLPSPFVKFTHLRIVRTSLCVPGTPDWIPWAAAIESLAASFCNEADVEVLNVFHRATGGPNWTNKEGWGRGSISQWYGIETDSVGFVVGIELSDNGLTGRLPSNLGNLAHLTQLTIDGNDLSGPLPLSLAATPLRRFHYADTGLCAPADDMFRKWLASIASHEGTGEECELSERDILEVLYAGTGGPSWSRKDNWLSDRPLGEWQGVNVDEDGRVTGVSLGNNGLTGPIPAELGALTNLRRLDLRGNKLSGTIPVRLGSLSKVEEMSLSRNDLAGPIPPQLGTLAQLRFLMLANNDFSGPIPPALGQLANVRWLFLQGNELTGPIPPELGKLSQLYWLDISNNGLTGTIPTALENLRELGRLSLSRNKLSGTVPAWLGSLRNLESLLLRHNELTGPIPPELESRAGLQELDLQGNRLTGQIPAWLGNLVSLQSLRLAQNDLTGPIPPQLGDLVNLDELIIHTLRLTGTIPPELGNLRNLRTLSISNTDLTGAIPAQFVNLVLDRFIWYNTRLCSPTDHVFQDWLTSLPTNQGEGPCVRDALAALYNSAGGAQWANNANWLTDEPVADWYGLTVDERGLPVSLSLQDNRLEGSITAELGSLPSFRQIDLSGNRLTGSIPPEVGKLTELRLLDLGENRLSGSIPDDFGELVQLQLLDLGANELTGDLPDDLGRLTRLETLDISDNRFAGSLPGSLANLTELTEFSWNDSGVCAPDVAWFQAWLGSIGEHVPGENCAPAPLLLDVPSAHLTQAVQNLEDNVPLIGGRPALLRVFATADRANAYAPHARATFYLGNSEVHAVSMDLESDRGLPLAPKPDDLTQSFSMSIPGEILTPGVEIVIEVDPDSIVPRAAGSTVRVPAEGHLSLDVRQAPLFELTIVPILYRTIPDSSVLDWADGFASGQETGEYVRHVLPVGEWNVTVREPYFTTIDPQWYEEWSSLLGEVLLVRTMDSGAGHYYGVMEPGRRSVVQGIGYLPGHASVGLPDPFVAAHELGHNISLRHTPCGIAFDDDPSYPYPGGEIGVSGYDARGDSLIPASVPDVMGSGCFPAWISDYHFKKALEYRDRTATRAQPPVAARESRLLLWGGISPNGKLDLNPAFVLEAPEKLPTRGGPYRLEGFGRSGKSLFSLNFAPEEVDHGGGSFLFTIPFEDHWPGSLDRIVLSGPDGMTTLDRESNTPMAIFMDRATGRIRSIQRGEAAALVAASADRPGPSLVTDPDIEILVSYGLPGSVPH